MVQRCKRAGVDEIACLLDFGVPTERVLASLPYLNEVREQANSKANAARMARAPKHFSVAAQIERHGVTHLQCTPSLAAMLAIALFRISSHLQKPSGVVFLLAHVWFQTGSLHT